MKWERNAWKECSAAGWHLLTDEGVHLGTVFADGSWYESFQTGPAVEVGSQPLAAMALLFRVNGVKR